MKCIQLYVIALAILFSSCKTAKQGIVQSKIETQTIRISGELGRSESLFHGAILSVMLVNDSLEVNVRYQGGCSDEQWKCVGAIQLSKSLPPQRSIELQLKQTQEDCLEMKQTTLRIGLSSFLPSKKDSSSVVLLLRGWEIPLFYQTGVQ